MVYNDVKLPSRPRLIKDSGYAKLRHPPPNSANIFTGNLNFVSKNNIRSNNIESMNIVDVYKMKVGDKHKELKPEYKVPFAFEEVQAVPGCLQR